MVTRILSVVLPNASIDVKPVSKSSGGVEQMSPNSVETEILISKTLPPLYASNHVYKDVGTPSNVFYRAYKSESGYAVLYIFSWKKQVFPPHKYDYEPVIVLTDKNMNPRAIYVDREHYFIKGYKIPFGKTYYLYTDNPWRSMVVEFGTPSNDKVEVYPVNEKEGVLGPNPTYLSNQILWKLRHRKENPLKINSKFIKNPWIVTTAKHWTTIREPTPQDIIEDLEKNYGINTTWSTEKIILELKQILHKIISKLEGIVPSRRRSHRTREMEENT